MVSLVFRFYVTYRNEAIYKKIGDTLRDIFMGAWAWGWVVGDRTQGFT